MFEAVKAERKAAADGPVCAYRPMGRRAGRWAAGLGLAAGLCVAVSSLPGEVSKAAPKETGTPSQPTLTLAGEAHSLTSKQAEQGLPVHLRGVVTSIDPSTGKGHSALFLNDRSGSIYVMIPDSKQLSFPAGTSVEVWGRTNPGSFAPIIESTRIRRLGAAPFPARPPRETLPELETGLADGKWVEVEGVVHSVVEHEPGKSLQPYVTLQLAMTNEVVGVSMLRQPGADYSRLIDATVRIRANAAPMFNRNNQIMGARLMAPGLETFSIVDPPPPSPFSKPVTAIDDLLRWDNLATERHRVHVRGRVTLFWPGMAFCISDATRGICAQTTEQTALALGEMADVSGFVAAKDGTPVLSDAIYRKAGPGKPVSPKLLTAEQALFGKVLVEQVSRTDYDSELIQVEGRLLKIDRSPKDVSLLLASDQIVFTAVLPSGSAAAARAWRVGSKLLVTGICSVRLDASSSVAGAGVAAAKSFQVLMRSAQDVAVLERPPLLTAGRALALAAFALLAPRSFWCG